MKTLSRVYMWVVFSLLYAPILVLVLFSFNRAGSLNHFSSFSLYWYRELFAMPPHSRRFATPLCLRPPLL